MYIPAISHAGTVYNIIMRNKYLHSHNYLYMQLLAQYSDISPEILKLIMLLADLLNGIIYQTSNLVTTEVRALGLLATLFPPVFFLLSAISYLFVAPLTIWSKFEVEEKVKLLFIAGSSLFGLTMYFFADNFYIFEEIRQDLLLRNLNDTALQMDAYNTINSIQPTFLVLAIIFFRAVPYAIELLSTQCGVDESLNDNTQTSVYVGILNVVVITIEFDSWFTIIQTTGDCSTQPSAQVISAWILWIAMIIIYCTIMIFSAIIGFYYDKKDNGLLDFFLGIIIIIGLTAGFGLYLLSDNAQPFDCYTALTPRNQSIMRLSFLLFSLAVYITFIFIAIFFAIVRSEN